MKRHPEIIPADATTRNEKDCNSEVQLKKGNKGGNLIRNLIRILHHKNTFETVVKYQLMSKMKFLVLQDLKSAPLPDEIAKELDVLSGFSNVASTIVDDENPLLQIPLSAARKNQNEGRSESRISTLRHICKLYYTRY